jgi:hypothetical protein
MAQEHLDMPGTNYGQQPHVPVNSFETKKKTKKQLGFSSCELNNLVLLSFHFNHKEQAGSFHVNSTSYM